MARILNHFRADASALAGAASAPVIIPRRSMTVSVGVFPGAGGSAYAQYTLADGDAVEADPEAVEWINWEPGEVLTNTARALTGPVIALRLVAETEDATMQVVASIDY